MAMQQRNGILTSFDNADRIYVTVFWVAALRRTHSGHAIDRRQRLPTRNAIIAAKAVTVVNGRDFKQC